MRKLFLLTLLCSQFACSESDPYSPDQYLSKSEQEALISVSIRYSDKLPSGADHTTKFDNEFDGYYEASKKAYKLECYYPSNDDAHHFFLITRVARSVTPLKEGIGGRIKLDSNGELEYYEEIFRTWKMPEDSLYVRGKLLFDRMVNGKDLTLYYSKYRQDRYIEFPDDRFYFSVATRQWHDRDFDSLQIQP